MKDILIADDHPIFRAGLRQIIEEEGYRIVAEAGDGKTCISSAEITKPHVVILDLAMPELDGYEVLRWIRKNLPDTIVIIVSMHSSNAYAKKAKELGARAFVAKEDAASEIHDALITPPGIFYRSASVGGRRQLQPELDQTQPPAVDLGILTQAERRIFDLVGRSLTSQQIAERLNVSHRTVQTHRANISAKLGARGHNGLYILASQFRNNGEIS